MTTKNSNLPTVRGKYRYRAELKNTNWFGVGGAAEILFKPADPEDLAEFMRKRPRDIPLTVLGVGSNVIIRDGGIPGVVIKLGRGFAAARVEGNRIICGAAALDVNVAELAAQHNLGGLEFLSGIPGTIGGALRMNAGAYGREIKDILVEAQAVTNEGEIKTLTNDEMGFSYRHSSVEEGWIFTAAVLCGAPDEAHLIRKRMQQISEQRNLSQPVRSRTGGSTFRNPPDKKAWQLIDAAGCRGLQVGGAKISPQHCNFMINAGDATAADLEKLGEEVRLRVKKHSGIELQWEIKRLGIRD